MCGAYDLSAHSPRGKTTAAVVGDTTRTARVANQTPRRGDRAVSGAIGRNLLTQIKPGRAMRGAGTALNVATVLVGSSIGVLLRHRLPDRTREVVTDALGLVTLLVAALSAASVLDTSLGRAVGARAPVLIVLGSLLMGGIAGSLLRLEDRLEGIGAALQRRFTPRSASNAGARLTDPLPASRDSQTQAATVGRASQHPAQARLPTPTRRLDRSRDIGQPTASSGLSRGSSPRLWSSV
jgi:hypothetical protein